MIAKVILREPLRIDNGGKLEVLTTAQSDLSVELDGGNMHGGAWTFGFAGAVVVGTANNSRLEFVASLTGDVLLNVEDAALLVVGDLALTGTIRLGGRNARLQFSGFAVSVARLRWSGPTATAAWSSR